MAIHNIYVDEDNVKWIANDTSIYKVESKDVATEIPIPKGQQSLLQLPGGNFDVRWSRKEINAIIGEAKITTAAYSKRDKMLWIGTDGYGVYKIKVDGGLRLIEGIFMDKSKLISDFINLIYISPEGKVWIATEDAAMLIENGSSSMHKKFFDVQTISGDKNRTWATGDGIVWIIDKKNKWSPIEINLREIEGTMHDIAFDEDGRIWIASNIMTSYMINTQKYEHFGPGQYFTSQFVNYVSVDADGTVWVGTDDKGVYIIEKTSTITVTTNLDKPLSCAGNVADAQISVRAVGGTPPYTYKWADGSTDEKRTNIGAGIYNLTVTDTEGSTKDAVVEIADPTIFLTLSQEEQVSEEGASDGIAVLLSEGGTPGYRAFWSTGSTATRIENLAAGLYTVTVTDQAGCSATGEVEITTRIGELSVALEQTSDIRCTGGNDASIAAKVSGGKSPYTYVWQNIAGNTEEVSGLTSGTYSLTITDVLGTTTTGTIDIADPPEFVISVDVLKEALTDNADGQAQVRIAGGTEPFAYAWSNGETSNSAITLGPAIHTVTVTDASGCTAMASFTITENILPLSVDVAQQDDILCAGEQTGGLTAQVEGGKGPFSFAWSNGEATKALTNIGAGTYTVTVTDGVGSTTIFETEITEPSPLVVNSIIDGVASTNNSDGRVTLSVQGGMSDYTFAWENGETSASATALAAGDHSVSVTDANGCMVVTTVTMSENILPLQVAILQQDDIICAGELTGALTSDVTGGKGPFSYAWSNGFTGPDNLGIGAGIYMVTVTDAVGTTAEFQSEITEPEAIVVNAVVESPASTDSEDGIALVNVTGGSPEYTYAWSNGESTPRAERLGPGDQVVTVTDANGCSSITTLNISEDILPLSVIVSQNELITCKGGENASVTATVTGGKGPFVYTWSSLNIQWQSGNAPNAIGLDAGVVSVTVTDAVSNSSTFQLEMKEPEKLVVNLLAEAPATKDNADGKARAEVTGGMGSYRYEWDTGETDKTAAALAVGSHSITVYDEAGCSATASIEITEKILPLDAVVTLTSEILCNGESTGAVEVQVSGGKGPFTYLWSNGASSEAIDQLSAGDYVATITDALGTEMRKGLTVAEPGLLQAYAQVVSPATTDASDGIADVSVEGGVSPFTYRWNNGEVGAEVTGLAPGAATVTVTDANGCTAVSTIEITENILPLSVDVERDVSNILCNGDATGIVKAIPNGGKGPFTFTWSDGSDAGSDRNDLGAGEYTLTVTDAEGSEATAMVPIQEPSALIANVSAQAPANTDQSDGRAQVSALGGTQPYSYSWDNGEDLADASQLAAGLHVVTVTDNNGCSSTAEIDITEDILPLGIQINQTADIACAGLSTAGLEALVSGGKKPFNYVWSDGAGTSADRNGLLAGEYTLTVTDAVGNVSSAMFPIPEPTALIANVAALASANTDQSDGKAQISPSGGTQPYTYSWDNGEVQAEAGQLAAGLHLVTVTDNNGCSSTAELNITEDILPLGIQINQTSDIACTGLKSASLEAVVSGGKGPFSYVWSDGGSSAADRIDLGASEYTLTVTDAVGNETTAMLVVAEPEALIANVIGLAPANTDQSDGKAQISASGGTEPYSYSWDNGETVAEAAQLAAGTHVITVTDNNGCSSTANIEITEDILPLGVQINQTADIVCANLTSATFESVISGGKGPFTYAWSDGGSTASSRSGMGAGEYILTVTDVKGTEATAAIPILQPEALIANGTVLASANTDQSDGKAQLAVSGGTTPYSFAWDNGEDMADATKLGAGSHSVTVTDNNGCTASATLEITEDILPLAVQIEQTSESKCAGMNDGAVKATISGGKGPFTYQWSKGSSGESLSGLTAGNISVTITDVVGQTSSGEINVTEPAGMKGEITDVRAAGAEHVPDGRGTADVTGGAGNYTYAWDSGESGQKATNLSIGSHNVTVTDVNGCSITLSIEITKKILPLLTAETLQSGKAVRMERLLFEADSTKVTGESLPTLEELYAFLYDNPTIVVEVGGHTNGLPEHDYADKLSKERAKSVAQWIVKRGIDEKRVYFKGYGKRKPVASNRTPDGRRKNQRVEVRILKIGD